MNNDTFLLSINSSNIIKDLQNLEDLFHFSDMFKNYEIFSNKNKKLICKLEIETLKYIW